MSHRLVSILSGCLLGLLAMPASADIYKCRLPDGQIEISSQPCAAGAKTELSRPNEKITPEQREATERELKRAREFIAEREALAERTRKQAAASKPAEVPPPPPPPPPPAQVEPPAVVVDPITRCMQDVERMGLSPAKREEALLRCVSAGKKTSVNVLEITTTTQRKVEQPAEPAKCTGKNCNAPFAPGK